MALRMASPRNPAGVPGGYVLVNNDDDDDDDSKLERRPSSAVRGGMYS